MSYGEPEDVPGQCNAHLYISDDFGDNHATIRCQLPPGHEGPHQEKFNRVEAGTCSVCWEHSERLDAAPGKDKEGK